MSRVTQQYLDEYFELINSGMSQRKAALVLGIPRTTLQHHLKKLADREVAEMVAKVQEQNDYTDWKPKSKPDVKQNKPRILFWDLESSLLEGYFFRVWQENIPMRRVKKHSHLLSASFAFNDEEVQGFRLTPEQVKTGNDFDLVCKVVEAVNNSDVMVTFNGKRFDVKLLNTRALFWGLPPVKQPKHIDLFEQSKRVFKFPSNSMQNVSLYLGEQGKLETSGSNLWERCSEWWNYEECDKALTEMLVYGNQDIVATRDLYYRFQGWMKGVPNLGTITSDISGISTLRCTHCGSDDVFPLEQKTYSTVSSFLLYRCGNSNCRGISRITKNGSHLVGVV